MDHREGPHLHREERDVALASSAGRERRARAARRRRRRPSPERGSAGGGAAAAPRPRRRATAAAPARTAERSAGDGRERLLIGSASIGPAGRSGRAAAAPPRVIRMAALWRRTLLAPTRSTPCFGSASSPRRSSSSRSTSALIYAVRRYRAERGSRAAPGRRRPPHPVPGRRARSTVFAALDLRRSASSSPTRRGRPRPPARAGLAAARVRAAEDRGDRPAVAVALRLPERRLLLLQAGRPGRHRGRAGPRLHRRRPHLERPRPGRQARRGARARPTRSSSAPTRRAPTTASRRPSPARPTRRCGPRSKSSRPRSTKPSSKQQKADIQAAQDRVVGLIENGETP